MSKDGSPVTFRSKQIYAQPGAFARLDIGAFAMGSVLKEKKVWA